MLTSIIVFAVVATAVGYLYYVNSENTSTRPEVRLSSLQEALPARVTPKVSSVVPKKTSRGVKKGSKKK